MREVRVAELLVPPDLLFVKELSLEPKLSLKKSLTGMNFFRCSVSCVAYHCAPAYNDVDKADDGAARQTNISRATLHHS